MKNLLKKGLLFLCMLALAASMTACGSSKSDDKKDDQKTEDTEKKDDGTADSGDSDTAAGKFKTVEDFVNSDIMQSQLESQLASLEESGIKCEVTADGDKLIYNYTVTDEAVAAVMDKETLDASLTSMADTFKGVAAMIPTAVEDVENPVVVVRYLDNTGAEITSMEFPAE